MWLLLATLAARAGDDFAPSLSERRALERQIRDATRALNEAPLSPDAPWLRDRIFTAQLALGWEDEAHAQLEMLIATTAPEAPWARANGAPRSAQVEALIEEELRMLALAWSAGAQGRDAEHSRTMLAEVCATYRARYPDEPRGAQLAGTCPPENP